MQIFTEIKKCKTHKKYKKFNLKFGRRYRSSFLFFKNIFAMFTFFEKIIQKYSIELRIWILLFKLVLRISCYDLIYKVIKNYLDLNDWKQLTVVYCPNFAN